MTNSIKAFFIIMLSLFIFSCSPSLSIKLEDDNSADIQVENLSSPSMNGIIKSFGNMQEGSEFYDKAYIKKQFDKNNFIQTNIQTDGIADIKISTKLADLNFKNEVLQNVFTISCNDKNSSLKIELSPDFLVKNTELIPGLSDYLELLMAPVFTGEELSQDEYIEVLASFYGNQAADEFKNSNFTINIEFPSAIKKVEKSKNAQAAVSSSGKSAKISIPIYKYLCSKETSFFTIYY
ncbi:MAG: hypothetical protein K5839_02500 [Treponemataceae bacterium]|nr:hypothetical protein [Treponemataceae bacterium]